jgi:hypothetical protein
MSSEREKDIIKDNHGRIMAYMMKNQAPGIEKFSETTPHIYLSNWKNGCDVQLLREQGIKRVLYLGTDKKPESVIKAYGKRNISHAEMPIAVDPPTNILPSLQNLSAFIHESVMKEEKILIHCKDGSAVSPSILVFYLLSRYYLTNYITNLNVTKLLVDPESMFALTIIKFLKQYRPCIVIHPALTYQILLSEMLLKRQFAAEFRKFNQGNRKKQKQKKAQALEDENDESIDEIESAAESDDDIDLYHDSDSDVGAGADADEPTTLRKPKGDSDDDGTTDSIESENMEDYISKAMEEPKAAKKPAAKGKGPGRPKGSISTKKPAAKGKGPGRPKGSGKAKGPGKAKKSEFDELSDLVGLREQSEPEKDEKPEPEKDEMDDDLDSFDDILE